MRSNHFSIFITAVTALPRLQQIIVTVRAVLVLNIGKRYDLGINAVKQINWSGLDDAYRETSDPSIS